MTFPNVIEWKILDFNFNFTEVCHYEYINRYANIDWVNGLAPIRQQSIIWTNCGLACWHIYASLALNELKWCFIYTLIDIILE